MTTILRFESGSRRGAAIEVFSVRYSGHAGGPWQFWIGPNIIAAPVGRSRINRSGPVVVYDWSTDETARFRLPAFVSHVVCLPHGRCDTRPCASFRCAGQKLRKPRTEHSNRPR